MVPARDERESSDPSSLNFVYSTRKQRARLGPTRHARRGVGFAHGRRRPRRRRPGCTSGNTSTRTPRPPVSEKAQARCATGGQRQGFRVRRVGARCIKRRAGIVEWRSREGARKEIKKCEKVRGKAGRASVRAMEVRRVRSGGRTAPLRNGEHAARKPNASAAVLSHPLCADQSRGAKAVQGGFAQKHVKRPKASTPGLRLDRKGQEVL